MNPLLELKNKKNSKEDEPVQTQQEPKVPTEMVAPEMPNIKTPNPFSNQETQVPPAPPGIGKIPPPPGIPSTKESLSKENKTQEKVIVPKPIKPGQSQSTQKLFTWNTGKLMTEEQQEIIKSGKSPDELTLEELRKVYYHVTAIPGRKVYSATTVNYIEKHGIHPDDGEREENEHMFIGNEVHSAMETKGESLKRLQCYADAGQIPEKPEGVKVSKDHENMIYEIAVNECTPAQAYIKIKDTATAKAITMEQLMEYEKDNTIYDHEDPKSDEGKELTKQKKAVEKVITAADKEFTKIKPHLNTYGKYLKDLDKWEIKKEQLQDKGGFIIDDLDFISSSGKAGKRIRDRIQATYNSLTSNTEVMEQYYMEEQNSNLESYVEFPILWKLQIGNKELPAKSLLDKVHFDFNNKKVYIQDIKTHGRKKHEFIHMNYITHKYYRTMSFYTEAVKYYLTKYRGVQDIDQWEFYNILIPVSTVTHEVGCFHPFLSISHNDIIMGKYGGFHKPNNYTLFDIQGAIQYCLDQQLFDKAKDNGFVHENAVDYKIKGWIEVIDRFERQFKPKI